MTKKPDDVTDAVWSDTKRIIQAVMDETVRLLNSGEEIPEDGILPPFIARAIMSAEKRGEEREREVCAVIADNMQPERGDIVSPDWYYGAACTATAIRNRQ